MFPKCGDGVDFSVILSPVGGGPVQYLHEADYELSDKPTRQRLHFYLDKLETGDVIDFTVYPRGQHDCDGALLLEAQIWEQEAYKARTLDPEIRACQGSVYVVRWCLAWRLQRQCSF